MNQVWNIFRKDVRHHWPEIAASLALLIAFTRFEIRSWSHLGGAVATGGEAVDVLFFFGAQMLPGLVNFLLPVSWLFLIVRVIQGESLVCDRQFWLTRPYDWKRLLAAKALFILVFINFPLLCMNVFLLAHAGFHPRNYVPGLLWLQGMWILFLFLWLTALATVTKSIAQMLLALLLIVLDVIGTTALSSAIHKRDFSGSFDSLWGLVVIIAAITIIFLQYSRRRTALSRWLVVAVCVLLSLIALASSRPTPDRASIVRQYPSIGDFPVQLGLTRTDTHEGRLVPIYDNEVSISLPMSVTGIRDSSFLRLDGMIATLTATNGFRWDSGWKASSQWLFSDQKNTDLFLRIKQSTFNQLSSGPVTVDFFLAFTLYQDKSRREFIVPGGEFRLSDIGLCTTDNRYSQSIHCLAPLSKPAFLLATSKITASTCPQESSSPSTRFVHAFVQGGPELAEMGISPVRPFDITFSGWDWSARRPVSAGICPGTPLTFSNPEVAGRRGLELQINDLHLDDFRERSPEVR